MTVGDGSADLADPDKHLATAFGIGSGGLVAVRPDGYIGLVADTPDPSALDEYLRTSLHRVAAS